MDGQDGAGAPRGTRTAAVMQGVRDRVASRALVAGDRLPSVRGLAATLGVSPSTVVEAYERLVAEGLVRSRPGSGFFVSDRALPMTAPTAPPPPQERSVDPFWVSRQSLDPGPATLMPGCGWLPADWLPTDALRRAVRGLARAEDPLLADYGPARGSPGLRRLLAARLAGEGLAAGPDQILLTASGTQAVDLVCRFLVRPGDTVLVDDPCYFNFRALLHAHRARVVGVPVTPTGPDLARFEAVLAAERPRLYLTTAALQNPTGATLSATTAHRVLGMAAAHDLTIVEDDIFAEFEPEPSVRLATLDGLQRVVRVGSFSKTVSASVRCGYVAARTDWVEGLVNLQVATGFGGPSPLAAELVAAVLTGSGYRRHLADLRRRLTRARAETAERLRLLGIEPWLMPRGGFSLWCRLPAGTDAAAVARLAMAEQVVLAPGNVFSVSQSADGFMRFNAAQCDDPRAWEVLRRSLARAGGHIG